jgi:modified peptide precursor CbpA
MSNKTVTGQAPHTHDALVFATRKSCHADGVGLSHYILMDKSTPVQTPAAVVASRKSCSADGVGLSHYILMDKAAG